MSSLIDFFLFHHFIETARPDLGMEVIAPRKPGVQKHFGPSKFNHGPAFLNSK